MTKHISAFVGRPPGMSTARRYVAVQRDRSLLRLWKGCPDAVIYMVGVAKGTEKFDEGRFKAAREILLRTLPIVSSQEVRTDATSINANVSLASGEGNISPELAVAAVASIKARIEALESGSSSPAQVPSGDGHDG